MGGARIHDAPMNATQFLVRSVACAALASSVCVHAGCRGDASRLTMEAGRGDEVDMAGMAYHAPLGGACRRWRWHSLFPVGQLHRRDPFAADRETFAATFIPYAPAGPRDALEP